MLSVRYNSVTGRPELSVGGVPVEARIVLNPTTRLDEPRDWQLWVARLPGRLITADKSPMRLLVESRLRGWLLRRYCCRLLTSKFATLRAIAEREQAMSDVAR